MSKKLNFKNLVMPILLIATYLFWITTFGEYLLGHPQLNEHGTSVYGIAFHLYNNLIRGEWPLWDPYHGWGMPEHFNIKFVGEFNPIFWLMPVLSHLGMPTYWAYIIFILSYYFLGLIGFYFLAVWIFQNQRYAYLSFLLLLFSSLSINLFNDPITILLFVPAVWFFYFLCKFTQLPKRHTCLGMVFIVMVVMTTYLPFYFVTVVLCFMFVYSLVNFKYLPEIFNNYVNFIRKNKIFMFVCLCLLLLSVLPGLFWFLEANTGELAIPFRQGSTEIQNAAAMQIGVVNVGGIADRVLFQELFANLDEAKIGRFYLPILLYLLVLLSVVNFMNRRLLVLFGTGFLLFLITLTDAAPIHGFLYKYVFFFKIFRNLYYLFYLAMPIIILFAIEQLRLYLEVGPESYRNKSFRALFVIAAHAVFIFFLFRQGDIILSSYVSVAVSLIIFLLHALGVIKKEKLQFFILLSLLAIIQPIEVNAHIVRNSGYLMDPLISVPKVVPKFSFHRPRKSEEPPVVVGYMNEVSGFTGKKHGGGLSRAYYLHEHMDRDILQEYVRNKIIIYDRVAPIENYQKELLKVQETFGRMDNVAFIPLEDMGDSWAPGQDVPQSARVLSSQTDDFEVLGFGLNFVRFKAKFLKPKFLVYNDNFNRNWFAYLNGKPVKVVNANISFKGIWVPAGENIIYFRYGPAWKYFMNFSLFFLYFGVFICLLHSFMKAELKN